MVKKYIDFIDEKHWIIINREAGDYNDKNRNRIKAEKIQEKLKEYDHTIFLYIRKSKTFCFKTKQKIKFYQKVLAKICFI